MADEKEAETDTAETDATRRTQNIFKPSLASLGISKK